MCCTSRAVGVSPLRESLIQVTGGEKMSAKNVGLSLVAGLSLFDEGEFEPPASSLIFAQPRKAQPNITIDNMLLFFIHLAHPSWPHPPS
mgnify:CR=1 FL=1